MNQGESMGKEDLVLKKARQDPEKPSKKAGHKKGDKIRRVTKMCKSGVQDNVVEIKLARSDSSYSDDVCNFRQVVIPGDDSDLHMMHH